MRRVKSLLLFFIFTLSISTNSNSQSVPASFADLAERLMPSVVNISTTTTITTRSNPFPFQFPPGSPFEDMFREFGVPQERQSSALGSGFIIDEKGIVVTNNHVITDAEDIIVRVNGDKEFKAKVIGADPLSDIAVLQLETTEKFVPVKFGDSDKARIGDWVIAIGNNQNRKKIAEKLGDVEYLTVISDTSITSGNSDIKKGSQILHNAVIQIGTKIGKHCIVNTSASIDHDCILEDFTFVGPNATLCGEVHIGEESFIGAGSVILPGIKIGKNCAILMNSTIAKNMKNNQTSLSNVSTIYDLKDSREFRKKYFD